MKKVASPFVFLLALIALASCQKSIKEQNSAKIANDLAVVDTKKEGINPDHLFVITSTGLSLREYNNLNSNRLAVMPYGSKIKILVPEENITMTVDGIKGAMHEVEFNNKTGFAFNGYLSRFFPPEKDIKPSIYAEDLKAIFPKVQFISATDGTITKPVMREALLLPTNKWHEAFYIAKELYNIPRQFVFPNPKGNAFQKINNASKTPTLWISEMEIHRKDNTLEKILYNYAGKGYSTTVSLTQEKDFIRIEKVETIY